MNIRSWLKIVCAISYDNKSIKRDAEVLLSFITGKTRSWLIAFDDTILSLEQLAQLNILLTRRLHGIPVAYLTGKCEFWSLPLTVSPVTLIPRPDTETLVEQALARIPAYAANILDLGTGTGAVALALASERPDCHVIGVDYIAEAVKLAQYNADKLDINNANFFISNWFSATEERRRFAIIVSNPPYIDAKDQYLQQGDVRFEPISALVAPDLGLANIRCITREAKRYLLPDGWLMLEHGWQQAEAVRNIFTINGYTAITTCQDYAGYDRVTFGSC